MPDTMADRAADYVREFEQLQARRYNFEQYWADIARRARAADSAMGGAAALKESPLPWSGLAGGAPAPIPTLARVITERMIFALKLSFVRGIFAVSIRIA